MVVEDDALKPQVRELRRIIRQVARDHPDWSINMVELHSLYILRHQDDAA
jgi:hypothetical protein